MALGSSIEVVDSQKRVAAITALRIHVGGPFSFEVYLNEDGFSRTEGALGVLNLRMGDTLVPVADPIAVVRQASEKGIGTTRIMFPYCDGKSQ